MAGNLRTWLEDRFGIGPIKEHVLYRRVVKAPWYYGDGATLFMLLGVQVFTGLFLALNYSPSPDTAYQSVRQITEEQPMGRFIRGLHYWSAGLMMAMLFFHLFRQILVAGYKSPREGTWLIGVLLFFCVIVMAFTGYLLRWDERSVYALMVSLHMFYRVPLIGENLVMFIQGGPELSARTLSRVYAVHVLFVPLTMFVLVGWHLYLVMLHGVTSKVEKEQPVGSAEQQKMMYKEAARSNELGEDFHPNTTARSGAMATVVFAVAVVLALMFGPAALYPEANLVDRSFPIEEWWFWWYSALIALLPPAIAPAFYVLFPLVVLLVLALLPFVDRSPRRGMRKRPVAVALVVLCVIGLIYLSELRTRSPWTGWPDPTPPPVPAGVELAADAEQGRQLFAAYGCNTCHAVAGHGRRVGTDLARIEHVYSREELRAYILNPPDGIPMPAYDGRIPDEDLELVVTYVLAAQTFPRE